MFHNERDSKFVYKHLQRVRYEKMCMRFASLIRIVNASETNIFNRKITSEEKFCIFTHNLDQQDCTIAFIFRINHKNGTHWQFWVLMIAHKSCHFYNLLFHTTSNQSVSSFFYCYLLFFLNFHRQYNFMLIKLFLLLFKWWKKNIYWIRVFVFISPQNFIANTFIDKNDNEP